MTTVQLELRRILGLYPTGVAAVAGIVDGRPVGLAANSFTSVSLDPPLVSVCVAHSSTTWPVLRRAEHLGISVLAAAQEAVCRRLAAKDVDRFAEIPWRGSEAGGVFVEGAAAWLDCSVHAEVPAGDHDIVVLAVHDYGAHNGTDHDDALVFHASGYRRLA